MIIAIEGLDGSGKSTLYRLLRPKLDNWSTKTGHQYRVVSFPQYGKTYFAKMVSRFLNGNLGKLEELPVHLTASLYAGDRFESRALFSNGPDPGEIVLLDRYVASNIAYQCARRPKDNWAEIAEWIYEYETIHLGLPKPDLNILLHTNPETSHHLVTQKEKRPYTDKKHDILEDDIRLLAKVQCVYEFLAQTSRFGAWSVISICQGHVQQDIKTSTVANRLNLRSPKDIAEEVWCAIVQAHQQI